MPKTIASARSPTAAYAPAATNNRIAIGSVRMRRTQTKNAGGSRRAAIRFGPNCRSAASASSALKPHKRSAVLGPSRMFVILSQ
jgi:hypothetical protein